MIDIKTLFASSGPASLQRMAGIFKKILKFYPSLKNQFLAGSSKEKEQVISWTVQLFERLREEIARTCDTIDMPFEAFEQQILSCFSPEEALLYREANDFVETHRHEIFAFQKKSTMRPILLKTARVFC
jgi:hypothetical protein